jgi:hypothetical protein
LCSAALFFFFFSFIQGNGTWIHSTHCTRVRKVGLPATIRGTHEEFSNYFPVTC